MRLKHRMSIRASIQSFYCKTQSNVGRLTTQMGHFSEPGTCRAGEKGSGDWGSINKEWCDKARSFLAPIQNRNWLTHCGSYCKSRAWEPRWHVIFSSRPPGCWVPAMYVRYSSARRLGWKTGDSMGLKLAVQKWYPSWLASSMLAHSWQGVFWKLEEPQTSAVYHEHCWQFLQFLPKYMELLSFTELSKLFYPVRIVAAFQIQGVNWVDIEVKLPSVPLGLLSLYTDLHFIGSTLKMVAKY